MWANIDVRNNLKMYGSLKVCKAWEDLWTSYITALKWHSSTIPIRPGDVGDVVEASAKFSASCCHFSGATSSQESESSSMAADGDRVRYRIWTDQPHPVGCLEKLCRKGWECKEFSTWTQKWHDPSTCDIHTWRNLLDNPSTSENLASCWRNNRRP